MLAVKIPLKNYEVIRKELKNYDAGIEKKPEIIALTKCDAISQKQADDLKFKFEKKYKATVMIISSVANQGLKPILFEAFKHVKKRRESEQKRRINKEKILSVNTKRLSDGNLRISNRIIIKIGSAILVDSEKGVLREDWLR